MSRKIHFLYISVLVAIVLSVSIFLFVRGISYYNTSLEERFYHSDHNLFKPSGPIGHGLGIIGTLLILFGVFSYILRKRMRKLSRLGKLKHWLEFHIFLCTLGPIMILYHTAFKFGGLVSISFWSMVAVVASGVIGRFIYIQIPRTIEGRELSLNEITDIRNQLQTKLRKEHAITDLEFLEEENGHEQGANSFFGAILKKWVADRKYIKKVRKNLRVKQLPKKEIRDIIKLLKNEIALGNRIGRLQEMQKLFKYWHVAHLPFAFIMLIIMVIHVAITLMFGYKWIF